MRFYFVFSKKIVGACTLTLYLGCNANQFTSASDLVKRGMVGGKEDSPNQSPAQQSPSQSSRPSNDSEKDSIDKKAMAGDKNISGSKDDGSNAPFEDADEDKYSGTANDSSRPEDLPVTGDGRTNSGTSPSDLSTIEGCLRKKADHYNILLIFDNSGSQTKTDPNAVRRDGALLFVDQFADYTRRNPEARVRFGVFSFNQDSRDISRGWRRAAGSEVSRIEQDIISATTRPRGGTAYSPVLREAESYFAALPNERDRAKNYVVFLTDGIPNAAGLDERIPGARGSGSRVERMSDIPPAINQLVRSYDVAMLAIASGPDLPPEGEAITRALAKPEVGTRDKNHVGVYFRARNSNELRSVWGRLLATIGDCQ